MVTKLWPSSDFSFGFDADGLCAGADNCPTIANADQADADNDGVGDACCCEFRGDVDGSGGVNVSDLTYLADFLFRGGPVAGYPAHGDVDSSGGTNISDPTYLVTFLLGGGQEPAACMG